MARLAIVQYPNKLLRRKGEYVSDVSAAQVQRDIRDMLETLAAHQDGCAALAATQLAIPKPYNIVVINPIAGEEIFNEQPLVLINPKLEVAANCRKIRGIEGCMSVMPDMIHAEVERYISVHVTALNQHGQRLNFTAHDFFARCLQHECDHLKGKIYLDYLPKKQLAEIDAVIKRRGLGMSNQPVLV